MTNTSSLSFLDLPPELRLKVYDYILPPQINRIYEEEDEEHTGYDLRDALSLLLVSRQIYNEAIRIFQQLNVFVRVETPWPQARLRVEGEGNVPIIASDQKASSFHNVSLRVAIEAPRFESFGTAPEHFVIFLDDLPRFCRMWKHADLTFPTLNTNLRLTLELNAPYTPSYEEKRVPKQLQRQMLLPFGEVKGLIETVFLGDLKPYASVAKELEELQRQPYKSQEACLRDATKFKDEGNAQLKLGHRREALVLYRQAWAELQILIRGRDRFEHADHWFATELSEEPYKGKNGQSERLYIRIELVAKTCEAYFGMKDYESCAFWGMRSVSKLREAMSLPDDLSWLLPSDEAISESRFPGVSIFGQIYKWAGLARYHLGERRQAIRLLQVAKVYFDRQGLPEDPAVVTALSGWSAR